MSIWETIHMLALNSPKVIAKSPNLIETSYVFISSNNIQMQVFLWIAFEHWCHKLYQNLKKKYMMRPVPLVYLFKTLGVIIDFSLK